MKSILRITSVILLAVASSWADTTYVHIGSDNVRGDHEVQSIAERGAQKLTQWEKENPDKKIVTVSANTYSGNGYGLLGFWVTYDKRPAKTEK
ncbi:MAG TPA: hypothetical protein VJJ47_02145 [Candidatus Paceibacterota bacterium]